MKQELINDIIELLHKINNPKYLYMIKAFIGGIANAKNKNIVSK